MLRFADLIAPLSEQDFLANYYGKKAAHLPAPASGGRRVLSWQRLNELLAIQAHWSDQYLKLVRENQQIGREHYCEKVSTLEGPKWRPDPAKVQVFMGMGASLVANDVQQLAPELRDLGEVLGEKLGGAIGANCYVSSGGIGGFGPHYDTTDVIAFHCEGEKVWRLYEGRADAPVDFPPGDQDAVRAYYKRLAGRVVQEVRMRPGDALYIPRGQCHDALAQSDITMHLTYAIAPYTGRMLLHMLETVAIEDPAFRAYLPDGSAAGPGALKAHLAMLADKLHDLVASPRIEEDVAGQQAAQRVPRPAFELPQRKKVTFYRTTGRPIEFAAADVARVGGAEVQLNGAAKAAAWIAKRPAFSDGELHARFQTVPPAALDQLVSNLLRLGAVAPV